MAFKTFVNGTNLPASDVNDYLMKQSVMTFASSAARASALTVPVEGMFTYLADVDRYEFWNGTAWKRITDDTYSSLADRTTNAYPVDGQLSYLTATSATDTANQIDFYNGSAWESIYTPGRNVIINGAFEVNQRNASSTTASNDFVFDRWKLNQYRGTTTHSSQAFTAGVAPVAGYEAANFARVVTSGQTEVDAYSFLSQAIEDVRTLAGQTATLSFWAKAGSGTPKIAIEMSQIFGSGGSPSAPVRTYAGQVTLSTSWTRYTLTIAIPSLSGKTVGTTASSSFLQSTFWLSAGTDFNSRTGSLGIQSNTFDIWGVQLEAGSVATPFRRAGGTYQGELATCQRYFEIIDGVAIAGLAFMNYFYKVNKRSSATLVLLSGTISPATLNPRAANYFSIDGAPSVNATFQVSASSEL